MDKESQILSRLAANHLYLAQFELLRAAILALRDRNPKLALSVLQTIVAHCGRFENILWSSSCSSPSLLTFLVTLELLQVDNASSVWSFDPEALRLRVEFLLLVQHLIDRGSEFMRQIFDLESIGKDRENGGLNESDSSEERAESPIKSVDKSGDSRASSDEWESSVVGFLDRILKLGVKRLRADAVVDNWTLINAAAIEEGDLVCLRRVIWEYADIFDALCLNIQWQISGWDEPSGLVITTRIEENASTPDDDVKILGLIQRSVQLAHIDAIKECAKKGNVNEAVSHIRFLHFDYGVEKSKYRHSFSMSYSNALQDLLKVVSLGWEEYGHSWHERRQNLLMIYGAALASNCKCLIQMLQVLHDDLLSEEIELYQSLDNNQIPSPLECFQIYVKELNLDSDLHNKTLSLNNAVSSCLRDMYQYALVSGKHVLECVMDAALSLVKRNQLQEASNIFSLFPRLQPLVAAMGWDILSGKTTERRGLMLLFWTSKCQVLRLEESSLYVDQSDEISCVEHLCDFLCYQLDIASFVACVNSGRVWNSKFSLMLYGKEQIFFGSDDAQFESFAQNFVLERLSVQSPLRVLFDVVPHIEFHDAIKLISMQPIASSLAAWHRLQDIELIHMLYALESAVLSLQAMQNSMADERESPYQEPLYHLKELQSHLDAITNAPRKIMLVNVIISLLHLDYLPLDLAYCMSSQNCIESSDTCVWEHNDLSTSEGANKMVLLFTGFLLDILRRNVPSTMAELQNVQTDGLTVSARHALEWRVSVANRFIEEWEWRLSVLQRLLPLTECQWGWEEALTVLRATPSKLLNLCLQRSKYDIGKEAVRRFSLSAEDTATVELVEWVDNAVRRASGEVVSHAADGTSLLQDLNFISLGTQLGPLAAILLCIDIAATSAQSTNIVQQLLNQAQVMLSEIYPGVSPEKGSTYWDRILEVGVISVSRRLLKRLSELLDKDNHPAIQAILSGELIISLQKESLSKGQRERALAMLHQMIEDAHLGKRQFLSGKLHNLSRAIADETEPNFLKGEGQSADRNSFSDYNKEGVLGLGLRIVKKKDLPLANNEQPVDYDVKNTGKRLFGPVSDMPSTYLSQFILYIAAIGDTVDGTDTTHDFNFFGLVYEWPKDLITRLIFDRGSTDAARRVADIMCADFVHEVVSASVPSVYPPPSGQGWACISVVYPCIENGSENKLPSFSSNGAQPDCFDRSSIMPGIFRYPLHLDIVKHLVKISPVRAVLACVFGSNILCSGSSFSTSSSLHGELHAAPDTNHLFYEFALDQSERFPTLKRWIQMQTNLHRVSEFAVTTKQTVDGSGVKDEVKAAIKRLHEHDSDTESEADDNVGGTNISTNLSAVNNQCGAFPDTCWQDAMKIDVAKHEDSVFLSFDWENEEPYQKAIERLIDEGKLMDALANSDRFISKGASDQLLQLLIEHEEENQSIFGLSQSHGGDGNWSNSWQYCLRLKDKQLAARLALKYMHGWELGAALDVVTMCSCHLPKSDPITNEVKHMKQALLKYNHILSADNHLSSWQEVEVECKEDPEGLALRLAEKGAVSAALDVAEIAGLSIGLQRELQGQQLVKLLTADPLNGGGPAEASRFLSSLHDSDDALPIAMGAMQLLPNLWSKKLLVHFFLKRREGNLFDTEISRLNSWGFGLCVLAALPLPWQRRCSSLHEQPHLLLEVLLMRKQLQLAALILKEFPSLQDDSVIIAYAAKAIVFNISSLTTEPQVSVSEMRTRQTIGTCTPVRSSFSNSLSNLQKEACRSFSGGPHNTEDKPTPNDVYRKRKSSGSSSTEKVSWEAMAGIQEVHVSPYSVDGQGRCPSVLIAKEWMLTGDTFKDDTVRLSHRYESAPDITLFMALLSLCSDESVSAKNAMELCVNQMKNVLSSRQLPNNASMEVIGHTYYATEIFVQGLRYAKSLLRKIVGVSDFSSNSERSRDNDDESSDAGSFSMSHQSTDELSEVLLQVDIWLGRSELLQSLLGSGIAVSLDDIADKESCARLRDRLIVDERYSMAVYTCKKCKIDIFPVWNAWGLALIHMEHYSQARVKFKQAFQLYKGDPESVITEIINTIEGGPLVDVSAVRSMYGHLAMSAQTLLDHSLSADSYLNVLCMPSTFPHAEKSMSFPEYVNDNSTYGSEFKDGPRSNLDYNRYNECVNYLQEYTRQKLLEFMFRHGQFSDACMLLFPPNAVPLPQPPTVGVATSSSSPQRQDNLATNYWTIDELCDQFVRYGAMPVLEEVISARISAAEPQEDAVNQYTAAVLARICLYCETHKHFNFLYQFQVIKKDYVAAGLCCIQLFINSASLEEAIKHLEHAKMYFDEGLSARYKGDSSNFVTKGIKGKSASYKLTDEGIVKFSARISLQVESLKSYNDADGSQWLYSLFGNPNDPETFRRRCKIAGTLVEKNFDLAFQVIYEFNLPAVNIYASVAASLAERKNGSQLTEFFRNIKGTIDDDDWDQVLGAAINVYANKHKECPDRLIDMLTGSHRTVLACVVCGRLKSAFQIASGSGSVVDVQYVAHQALHANAFPVLNMCKQWLAQFKDLR